MQRAVGEAESFRHELPVLAVDEQPMQRHVAAEIAFQIHRRLGGVLAPEPLQRVGKNAAAVLRVVAVALDEIEPHVVAHVAQRGVHLLVGQRPVAELVVHVAARILLDRRGAASARSCG